MECTQAIDAINIFTKQFIFFEFSIYSYSRENLVIVGSQDLIYHHSIEIHFKNPFHIISKTEWIVNVDKIAVEVVEGSEWHNYNKMNRIESGNKTIKFIDQDGLIFYYSFAEIEVFEKLVKYNAKK